MPAFILIVAIVAVAVWGFTTFVLYDIWEIVIKYLRHIENKLEKEGEE